MHNYEDGGGEDQYTYRYEGTGEDYNREIEDNADIGEDFEHDEGTVAVSGINMGPSYFSGYKKDTSSERFWWDLGTGGMYELVRPFL